MHLRTSSSWALLGQCRQVHDGVYQGACFVRCLHTLLLDLFQLSDWRANHLHPSGCSLDSPARLQHEAAASALKLNTLPVSGTSTSWFAVAHSALHSSNAGVCTAYRVAFVQEAELWRVRVALRRAL